MVGGQPWMYSGEAREDWRLPNTTFDPKAVTRASWQPKPVKPKQDGPLLSFNRHPDAHAVLTYNPSAPNPMGPRTKIWIKRLRWTQMGLRILELNGAIGVLGLMVLLTKQDLIKGWVMKIAPAITILHCIYAIYHLSRAPAGRTPASSAAYHIFSAISDLVTLALYAFSAFTTHQDSAKWGNRISGHQELTDYFVPAVYYTMVGAGGLHVISLALSLWLSYAFRKISLLPPDMNPLEDHLTARPKHKWNKLSTTTTSSSDVSSKMSASRPGSEMSTARTSVPFMHTRGDSNVSLSSSPRWDLPSREYQIIPGTSTRNSAMSVQSGRSRPPPSTRGSYAGLPVNDGRSGANGRGSVDIGRMGQGMGSRLSMEASASRANIRSSAHGANQQDSGSYAALTSRYALDDSDSDYGDENEPSGGTHPNPLASNPPRASRHVTQRASMQPSTNGTLGEVSANGRPVSETRGFADAKGLKVGAWWQQQQQQQQQRQRDSSIQPDDGFYSKPYGALKGGAPPVMVGNNSRKVSSGNDYGLSNASSAPYERRNVSGKIAEEGMAGNSAFRHGGYSSRNY